jgi:hypothetical protein
MSHDWRLGSTVGLLASGSQVGPILSCSARQSTDISRPREIGVAPGDTYDVSPDGSPDLCFIAEPQYDKRHLGGFDFLEGTVGPARDARGQGVALSALVNW